MAQTTADETTRLLPESSPQNGHNEIDTGKREGGRGLLDWLRQSLFHVEKRILFAGFLITLSFSYTQVPIFYALYLMECNVYYSNHPPFAGPGDRCSVNEVAARTATQFSILGMATTFCGTINLFVAGWTVKRFGPRLALMVQVFVPAIRVATQILGVMAGGQVGIIVFQCTQLITVIGGPAGYILVVNIIAGELVTPSRRTAVFGMLQGCLMLGQGIGYLVGGMIGDLWGVQRPFEVAFFSFLIATVYCYMALPYISPESMSNSKKPAVKGIGAFFAPLKVLVPQRLRLPDGSIVENYGVMFLCAGVFLGVLATGYAPLLIQLYGTTSFHFQQSDNGYLMSGFAFMRALFLIIAFPPIISRGRAWYIARHPEQTPINGQPQRSDDIPTRPEELEAPMGTYAEDEPVAPSDAKEDEGTGFDLLFLKWSLVLDGALTMGAAFATQKWHIFLAAFLLPFASGTAPAAKGVMTEMCAPSQRPDALSALTLVENIARLATQGLFGFIFAALAGIDRAYLTFFVNAAIALLAVGVLFLSQYAPSGSKIIEDDEGEESEIEPS
ncbi:major facilitator superfamily domain-containing protein [Podospora didyma]|uniref:Major facilitator superfamily domain-containing protein n=1 Tax=Podospora didyma TaxID=330526 RepID=A0AAE0K1P7_9PEZI|nr:major facilitator superfamily domain-containing protein [Podospora didyma]